MMRYWGVRTYAVLLMCAGSIGILWIVLDVLDSLRFYGWRALWISTPEGLAGFFLYAVVPVVFYMTGLGLFAFRTWARKACLLVVPLCCFALTFNITCHTVMDLEELSYATVAQLLTLHPEMFFLQFMGNLVFLVPMILYFNQPLIVLRFEESQAQSHAF